MTIEQRRLEQVQTDVALTSAYLKALQAEFPNVPDSQLLYAAAKMAGDRRMEDALLAIDGIVLEMSTNLLALMEELT